jgi:hypothetical protein
LRREGEDRFGGIERLRTVADVADDFVRRGLGQEGVDIAPGELGAVPDPFRTTTFAAEAHKSRDRPGWLGRKRRGGTEKR